MSAFRDVPQRAAVCRSLCALVGLTGMWTATEPTASATELGRPGPSELSRRDRTVVQVAWDIWSESGYARVLDVMALDLTLTLPISELITAMSRRDPKRIDAWLREYGQGLHVVRSPFVEVAR